MNPSKFPRNADSFSQRPGASDHAVGHLPPHSSTFSPEDYAVGQVLSGRFRVEHVIGVGSMGVVLAARHLELDERVAIKFIRAEMQKDITAQLAKLAEEGVTHPSEISMAMTMIVARWSVRSARLYAGRRR